MAVGVLAQYGCVQELDRTRWLVVRETSPVGSPKPRLLDRVRETLRTHHDSRRTEKAYVGWVRRDVLFHGKRHSAEMGAPEVGRFLTSLAIDRSVAASTQNQALSALLFLYRHVLGQDLPWLDDLVRAKRRPYLPVVLTRDEVRAILDRLDGVPRLMATLMYGAGLRLLECARLRVKDVGLSTNQLVVRGGKGEKDRMTMLPASIKRGLELHLAHVRAPGRPRKRRRVGGTPLCPRAEVPARRPRIRSAANRETRCAARRHHGARDVPHVQALVRDPPAGGRPRYPDGTGTARPQRRLDHDDLHARPEPGPGRSAQSGRSDVRRVTAPLMCIAAAGDHAARHHALTWRPQQS